MAEDIDDQSTLPNVSPNRKGDVRWCNSTHRDLVTEKEVNSVETEPFMLQIILNTAINGMYKIWILLKDFFFKKSFNCEWHYLHPVQMRKDPSAKSSKETNLDEMICKLQANEEAKPWK